MMDLCAIRATFVIARKRVSEYRSWMRRILRTHVIFHAIIVHIRSYVSGGTGRGVWWRGGIGGKGVRGEKEEGCCVTAGEPRSTKVSSGFARWSDWLPQISGGDGGTRVHTQAETRTGGLERKIRGGTGGWRRGSKENTSQERKKKAKQRKKRKQKRFPRRLAQLSVGRQQRADACPRPWIHSFIHLLILL